MARRHVASPINAYFTLNHVRLLQFGGSIVNGLSTETTEWKTPPMTALWCIGIEGTSLHSLRSFTYSVVWMSDSFAPTLLYNARFSVIQPDLAYLIHLSVIQKRIQQSISNASIESLMCWVSSVAKWAKRRCFQNHAMCHPVWVCDMVSVLARDRMLRFSCCFA